jgi:hypothetical protein
MRILFLILILPTCLFGQTIHIKDEKIVYEGKEKVNLPAPETFSRIQQVLPTIVHNYKMEEQSENSIKARGQMKLETPYHLIRTVSYSIKLHSTEKGYEYTIDSVFFTEQERGEKANTVPSKEVVKNMGETGAIVGETEKILNETDMRFQKLLALLKSKVKAD